MIFSWILLTGRTAPMPRRAQAACGETTFRPWARAPHIMKATTRSICRFIATRSTKLRVAWWRAASFIILPAQTLSAQAASGADIYNPLSPGQVTFRGAIGGNTGVSPFFVDLNLNGAIEVWTNG